MLAEGRSREKKRFARITIKTWQKPETALEKSVAPRVIETWSIREKTIGTQGKVFGCLCVCGDEGGGGEGLERGLTFLLIL